MSNIKFSFQYIGLCLMALLLASPLWAQNEDFRKQAPKPGPAPTIELGDYQRFSLDNGLEVIVVENHKLPRVSFQIFVDAPLIDEGDQSGYLDMAGQLLTKGTAKRTKAEIDEAVDYIGATLNSSSSGLFGASLTKHAEKLLDVMQEVLLMPSFPEEEFEKLRKQQLSALAQAKEDPNAIAGNVADVLRYSKEHPYGAIQTEESTKNITLEACKSYYQNYFKPNISYLVIVGDITPEKAKRLASTYFGKWEKGTVVEQEFPRPEKPSEPRVVFVDKSGAVQSVINVTYPLELEPGSADLIAAGLMNTALGGYFRSRLNNNLREDKGYTYGARSNLSEDEHIGSFNAYASVRNEVTDSSMAEFLKELNRLREEPLGEQELALVKNYESGSFALSLESPQTIARFALNIARYDLPEDYYATYLSKVEKVSADDILTAAKKYLTPDQAYLLVVGNKGEVAESLLQFDGNEEIEYMDAYGNPISEEGMEIPEGTTAKTVLEDYLQAIGGRKKLERVENVQLEMLAETMMGALEFVSIVQHPNQYYNAVMMGGNPMQIQFLNGDKGKVVAQGQTQELNEEEVAGLQEMASPFNEAYYEAKGFKLELAGMEKVEGEKAYKIEVTTPSGGKTTEYYSVESSLKIRELRIEERPNGQTATVIQDYSDYQPVEGILIPHAVTISGMMPFPLELTLQKAAFNIEVEEGQFGE